MWRKVTDYHASRVGFIQDCLARYQNVYRTFYDKGTCFIHSNTIAPPTYEAEMKKDEVKENEMPIENTEPEKRHNKKNKTSLRYLNKSDLLEIILEQEKMLVELNSALAEAEKKLDDREIILNESGSIAEAALKLNGIFEVAQKSADEFLESTKKNNVLAYPYQKESAGEISAKL